MSNKFVTFLEDIGADFKNGLAKLMPIVAKGVRIAEAATPEITALDPAVGAIFQTVVATVSTVEQKFAAMGAQTGTGTQKLAQAATTLQPLVTQALAAGWKPSDATTVTNYINAVVGFLNAIPASTAAPAPAAA